MKRNTKNFRFEIGEIVKLRSTALGFPEGIYRVDGKMGSFVMLSAGDVRIGAHVKFLEVLERNLVEPNDWIGEEVNHLRFQVDKCGCLECAKQLAEKEESLRWKSFLARNNTNRSERDYGHV